MVALDYGRKEMLSIIHEKMEEYDGIKELPQIISDMVSGKQEGYIKAYFDSLFSGNGTMSGMRFSVYCSDKMAFEDPAIIRQQEIIMPWLAGFHVTDVYGAICDAWPVKPIDAATKKPFYSNVPVLLGRAVWMMPAGLSYDDTLSSLLPKQPTTSIHDTPSWPVAELS